MHPLRVASGECAAAWRGLPAAELDDLVRSSASPRAAREERERIWCTTHDDFMTIRHARRPCRRAQARNPRVQQLVDALQLGLGTQPTSGGQSPEGPAHGSASWRRVPLEHLGVKGIVEALSCLSKLGDNERFETEMEALVQVRAFVIAVKRFRSVMS